MRWEHTLPRSLIVASVLAAVMTTGAFAATLTETLTTDVVRVRDVQVKAKAASEPAQAAVEAALQAALAQSGASADDAIKALTETAATLRCVDPAAPTHPVTCPQWTSAAIQKVLAQIVGVTKLAPGSTGGNGAASIPPPPAFGAGGGGGGSGYREN